VFIGFGSMTERDPEETRRIIIDALAATGERGVLLANEDTNADVTLPDNIFQLTSCPYSWLFPRMKVIVHHGGAGTTADAFRAGKPQVTIPFFSDQPFWSRMTHQLGVGVKPLSKKTLTSEALTTAIRQASTDQEMQRKADALGQIIRTEDGVGNAVRIVQGLLGENPDAQRYSYTP
ncbi:MAG: glycosyltransferase family 1 protein, partial [Caldilineaceae bacterium]|nr:glycosyltransferase family 1 protein [Caldilineaceae bacterium]